MAFNFMSGTSDIGGAGLAMQAVGAIGSYLTGQKIAGVQQQEYQQSYNIESNISGLQQQVNNQRQQQMDLSARRQNVEDFRQAQMARAKGLSNAAGSGMQFSSSAIAGQGNATSMGLFNSQGVNQNLEIGNNMFNLDNQISTQKLALSNVQTKANEQLSSLNATNSIYGGLSSFGGAATKNASTISNIFGLG